MFGFSRNILARAISQYRYLTHFMPGCPLVPWSEFCADPFVLGDVCQRAAAAGNPCCRQSPEHQYVHVLPQAHCFTTAANESVSFISLVIVEQHVRPCCLQACLPDQRSGGARR